MSDTTMNEIAKTSPDMREQRIEQLKELLPDLFDGEGQLDETALRGLICDEAGVVAERFSFGWAGKQKSKRLAFTPSRATLVYDPARSLNHDGTQNKAGQTAEQNTSENLIIEGDNLEVLKLLQATYFEQVKCIYIDPPYNTGKDFIYPDNFTESKKAYWEKNGEVKEGVKLTTLPEAHGRRHSDWLNFMQSRLLLARQTLREDGVIFVSIDDNEVHNLRKLMDEVFGEENFIGLLSVENNPKGRKNSKFISVCNDYCLIYAKNKENTIFVENIPKSTADMKEDENGDFIHNSGKRILVGENSFNKALTNFTSDKNYSAYYNEGNGHLLIEQETHVSDINENHIIKGYKRYISSRDGFLIENTYTKNKILDLYDSRALEFKENKIFEKNFSTLIRIKSVLTNKKYEAVVNGEKVIFTLDLKTTSAGTDIKELFGTEDVVFTAPKNTGLLKVLITLFNENDLFILDFFAGSGTSAHAIMQQNAEDGGNRKHIMVQIPEFTDEKSEAYKAGYKKISDITIERVKRAGAKIREENPDAKIDTGFRVFKLTHSNFAENLFTPDEDKSDAENMKALETHLTEATQTRLFNANEFSNLVTEISLKNGFGLFYQLEAMTDFEHNKIYRLHGNGKSALLCLDNSLHDTSVENLKPFKEKQLIVSKSALDTSKKFSLQTEFKDNLWIV